MDGEKGLASLLKKDLEIAKKDLEIAKKDVDIANLAKDKDVEIANLAKDKDVEIANLAKDKDVEIANLAKDLELSKKDIELLKVQYKHENERLQIKLREANWEVLKTHQKIHVREFLKMFVAKCVENQSCTTWNNKWTKFLETKTQSLDEWYFDQNNFMATYWELYKDLNKNAHPIFVLTDCLEIPLNMFSKSEFRLLGFLWENYELPLNNFKIVYGHKPAESVDLFKKHKVSNECL
ncbi:uncharacterized protein [Euwallacea similis]|uniref:uncharacterized protein n=1 Tax=Euwallacea similis TaxID=1736056 RepID=UPI00344B5A9A